jgi:tetratricopeptide (TPR) repeat protein
MTLSIDELKRLLPETEEVFPLLEEAVKLARPDEDRQWAGSGELGTLGSRHVDPDRVREAIPTVLKSLRGHLSALYDCLGRVLDARQAENPAGVVRALLDGAELEVSIGRFAQADRFVAAALSAGTDAADGRIRLPALLAAARLARRAGRWETAESRYAEARSLAAVAEDPGLAATAAIGLGNLAVDRGAWVEAVARYAEAESWIQGLPGDAPERWHLALNRSIVAREEGRIHDAETSLAAAADYLGEDADADDRAIVSNARGQLLRAQGRDDEAEVAFRHALKQATSHDALVTIRVNLGETLLSLGRSLEAGEIARDAEQLALTQRVVPRLPEVYRVLGRIASDRGHADAFVFFERSLEIIAERELPAFERAMTLEAYGRFDLNRDEVESGRARLAESARVYGAIGCTPAAERVQAVLDALDAEEDPGHTNGKDGP